MFLKRLSLTAVLNCVCRIYDVLLMICESFTNVLQLRAWMSQIRTAAVWGYRFTPSLSSTQTERAHIQSVLFRVFTASPWYKNNSIIYDNEYTKWSNRRCVTHIPVSYLYVLTTAYSQKQTAIYLTLKTSKLLELLKSLPI